MEVAVRRRRGRPRLVRAVSVPMPRSLVQQAAFFEAGAAEYPEEYDRPRTRAECVDGPRPCPFAGCRWNLFLDVSPKSGAIKFNFPELELWEMGESCTLDLAERGGLTLESVGAVMNLTRERVRQLEGEALMRAAKSILREHA